jgi:hypothetical protein
LEDVLIVVVFVDDDVCSAIVVLGYLENGIPALPEFKLALRYHTA